MKKTWLLFASLTLAISMLAACNSTNKSKENEDETDTQVESGETTGEETSEENVEEPTTSENRDSEKTLTYSVNKEVKEATAKLTESKEQNYSLYKLDGFTLTGEEPNKDSLYLDDNPAVFMRVETISKDDASLEIIAKNMHETMTSVSINKEPIEIGADKLPKGEGVLNPSGYQTTFELGTVSGFVFEQGNLIVRLTIFDQKSVNQTDAFLKMGETIAAKK
ncbi:hypothetical protein [Paenisporosarcina sp. OV554]|uniref:hypothetical protein n=1 Tax=Paenisporosarcina sp. OV554 TaxID=2135694 RepID=UPI000D3D24A7|nr:hypothetical protein [Paenisporosarcina sp. OV554]PUB17985.1 hypothetical protein C8K15_101187 [Paenisporosarcina sp. OV554]